MAIPGWSVIVFETKTGRIILNDINVVGVPQFSRQINQSGSVQVKVLVSDPSTPDYLTLRNLSSGMRYSLGVVYGDGNPSTSFIAQAGPVMTHQYNDQDDSLTITAGSLWSLFNHRMLTYPAGGGVSLDQQPTTGTNILSMAATYDLNYSNFSLHTIAKHLVQDNCSRFQFNLPIDYPADITGTNTRSYPIYDLATLGQRLQELTQVNAGPDIDFSPYFDPNNAGYVRWQMLIGNPTLSQIGSSFYWDYKSSIKMISTDSDASNMATGAYVKGNSTERSTTVAYNVDATLTTAGWPATEYIDTSHTSISDNGTLNQFAVSDLALYARPVEIWKAIVPSDASPTFGTYLPGSTAVFNIDGHRWIPNGQYSQRILGFKQGQNINEVELILQALQGQV